MNPGGSPRSPSTASWHGARPSRAPSAKGPGRGGFTLLEVVLALSIAVGLLAVVLHFHQQITRLRDQVLADSAELAAIRLCMDRFATELRTVANRPDSFRGDAAGFEFTRSVVIEPARSAGTNGSVALAVQAPFRHVTYRLAGTNETGSATGLERLETSASVISPTTAESLGASNETASEYATPPTAVASAGSTRVVIPEVRHLALRYWDGSAWNESWTASGLPRGIEINLAADAPPPDATPGSMPRELFRRIVALPAATVAADDSGARESGGEGSTNAADPLAEVLP